MDIKKASPKGEAFLLAVWTKEILAERNWTEMNWNSHLTGVVNGRVKILLNAVEHGKTPICNTNARLFLTFKNYGIIQIQAKSSPCKRRTLSHCISVQLQSIQTFRNQHWHFWQKEDWDEKREQFKRKHPDFITKNDMLQEMTLRIQQIIYDLSKRRWRPNYRNCNK